MLQRSHPKHYIFSKIASKTTFLSDDLSSPKVPLGMPFVTFIVTICGRFAGEKG
jgi:hypothetical protein